MKISIGVPMYNCEATIRLTIQSIFAQTFQDWELIIVDDGSKDRSLDIVRQIEDPRVRIIADGRNKQLSYRLNQLIEMSRGKYIARMDADDLMHPDRLARQLKYFEQHPTCHVLGSSIYLIDHKSHLCGQVKAGNQLPPHHKIIEQSMYFHPTIMAKADWYRAHKYDARYVRAEDMEFWCRATLQGSTNFGLTPEPLLYYRKTGFGTLGKTLETLRTQRRICLEYGPKLAGPFNTCKSYLRTHALGLTHRLLEFIGQREQFLRARDQPLSSFEHTLALQGLTQILETQVPGWQSTQQSQAA